MRAALLIAALATTPAWALDLPETYGLHLATGHSRGGYESQTPGVYLRWNSGLTLGAYRNSDGRDSAYAAWTFSDRHDRLALTVGAVSGYGHGVKPLLAPSVRLPLTEHVSARLTVLPRYEKGSAAVHLSIEWRQ